jgi:hypothetical protein
MNLGVKPPDSIKMEGLTIYWGQWSTIWVCSPLHLNFGEVFL